MRRPSVQTLRNVAIIALIALGIAFVPGGGNAAETLITAISLAFAVAIGFALYRLYTGQRYTLWTMPDQRRGVMFAAIGVLALCFVGIDEAFSSDLGLLLWLVGIGGAVLALVQVYQRQRRYDS
ncbi:MAG: hypothetical protein ACR2NA_04825 [Solirubrobacterales bacterium]